MQMRERGRQRGEIYSRHENGASVSEIRSVVGGFLQDLVQQCVSFLSARIIDKRKFLSCFRGPFERKRKVGDERSATLFGTVHSQWCGQLDVIRDLWLRGREKLDGQPSKTLRDYRMKVYYTLRFATDSSCDMTLVCLSMSTKHVGISWTLMQCMVHARPQAAYRNRCNLIPARVILVSPGYPESCSSRY